MGDPCDGLVPLLMKQTAPGTSRVRADTAEFVTEAVKVVAEEAHDLHAELRVAVRELEAIVARTKRR